MRKIMCKFGPFCFGTRTNFSTLRTVDYVFSNGYTIVISFKKLNFLKKNEVTKYTTDS